MKRYQAILNAADDFYAQQVGANRNDRPSKDERIVCLVMAICQLEEQVPPQIPNLDEVQE